MFSGVYPPRNLPFEIYPLSNMAILAIDIKFQGRTLPEANIATIASWVHDKLT